MFGIPINGKWVVTCLVGFVLVFGMGFWWFQEHAFYDETYSDVVTIEGWEYPVTQWKGITSDSSPLKMRACFVIKVPFEAEETNGATPLVAPGWFRCFDAKFLTEQLDREYAKAYIAQRDDPKGFDRIIAILPGGRSYMWRQPSLGTGVDSFGISG
jgi:hypothetical protein